MQKLGPQLRQHREILKYVSTAYIAGGLSFGGSTIAAGSFLAAIRVR